MERRFMMITDRYNGFTKKAVDMLYKAISGYFGYVLPVKLASGVSDEELREYSIIALGEIKDSRILTECHERRLLSLGDDEEGYSIYVGKSIYNSDAEMIAIGGYGERGVMYACADFYSKYCGGVLYKDAYIWEEDFFKRPFDRALKEWSISASPAIKTRAIWTWGQVIYDYRRLFENMLTLRLNEIVIWNDCAPLNGRDVVEYAHSLGIKVIWGFAWGWTTSCEQVAARLTPETVEEIKTSVLDKYEREYAPLGGDGIYFQSFTELSSEKVGEVSIAEAVTSLVNDISATLLKREPTLHIQFGLHATSVKNRLDIISKVDKRIYIVWEDCGAFPYNYYTDKTEDFEDTLELTERLCTLRGKEEKFGAVLKGMLNLDWHSFEHFSDSYILGERTRSYIDERQTKKDKIWKIVQAGWLKNAELVRRTVEKIADSTSDAIAEALVEDAMLENEIMLPVAIFAELLWTPHRHIGELIEEVSKYPSVKFANI